MLVSPITIVPPYYIPPHMHNFEESNFVVSEYNHSLDHEEVQHLVETLFEGMHFLTKQGVQHALQQYHVSKGVNYMTQLRQSRDTANKAAKEAAIKGKPRMTTIMVAMQVTQ